MSTVLNIICDSCGQKVELRDSYDGGEIVWRRGEEDEFSLSFEEICPNCFNNSELFDLMDDVLSRLHQIFPHGQLIRGAAREAAERD